ncbi:uncharacterized protein METZ01_LOCUS232552, partial [marine metagenome]
MRAQQRALGCIQVKRVLRITRGMIRRRVKRIEAVILILNF